MCQCLIGKQGVQLFPRLWKAVSVQCIHKKDYGIHLQTADIYIVTMTSRLLDKESLSGLISSVLVLLRIYEVIRAVQSPKI